MLVLNRILPMSSDSHSNFEKPPREQPAEDLTEHLPDDPNKTWVPEERESFQLEDTQSVPGPPKETEAGSQVFPSHGTDVDSDFDSDDEAPEHGDDEEPPTQFGNYELLEHVGRGGMGNVYKARDRELDRVVALKTLKSGTAKIERQVQRFVREAKAAARLDHPNIVTCYEFGEFEGWNYLTMAFVAGESMHERLVKGPLEPEEAARILFALAKAVSYAHQNGVIHRDIKPGNVLLGEDGRPRLTDFGIAKLIAPVEQNPLMSPPSMHLTQVGQALGTPGYMAPEQMAGRKWEVGPLADIYSLGGLLVAALTGHHPSKPNSSDTFDEQIPEPLQAICDRCLADNPKDRYPTAAELAMALESYLQSLHVPPPTEAEEKPSPQKPRKKFWTWFSGLPGLKFSLPPISFRAIVYFVGFVLAVLVCSYHIAKWITGGSSSPVVAPRSSPSGGAPLSQADPEPTTGDIKSHLLVLVGKPSEPYPSIEDPSTMPLKPDDQLLVDVKVDRSKNAAIYLIQIPPLGPAKFLETGKPVSLSQPVLLREDRGPDYGFRVRANAQTYPELNSNGQEGLLTVVLLTRKNRASEDLLAHMQYDLDSLGVRHHPLPRSGEAGSIVQRFSVRQNKLPPKNYRMILPKDHAVYDTLEKINAKIGREFESIEAISFAVPGLPTPAE